jgi:TPR repeat protein
MSFKDQPNDAPSADLTVPQQALWWLKKGGFAMGPEWEKAHALCQQSEGTREYDLVHALAHWIEGDDSNATYWYRKVGGGRAATIEQEWERVAGLI